MSDTDTNQDEQQAKANSGAAATQETEPFAEIKATKNDARAAAELIPVSEQGVISPENFAHMVDMAKWMALDRVFTPPHLRGSQAACVTVHKLAAAWGLAPEFVSENSYVVKGRIGYGAQLWNAVMYHSGKLEGRLQYEFKGEGDERYVIVRGKIKGEPRILEYQSPAIAALRPRRNEDGEVRGSPLWDRDPDQQLSYYGSRAWQRRHAPEVMPGIYGRDELLESYVPGPAEARDITGEAEALALRLEAAKAAQAAEQGEPEGFRAGVVRDGLAERKPTSKRPKGRARPSRKAAK